MTKRNKQILGSLIALVIVLGGALALVHDVHAQAKALAQGTPPPPDPYAIKGDTISLSADTAKTAGIETQEVKAADIPSTLTLSGHTDLDQEKVTHVHAQFPGKVVHVGPQLGDKVLGPEAKGGPTILCSIESTDLAQAKAGYLQAQVQLKLDEDNLGRTRELLKKQILAEKYLLDAQSAVTKSRAILDASRQQLLVFGLSDKDIEGIGQQIGKQRMTYNLTSPRTGMIVEKGVVGGELADPTLNLFTVADTSDLWVWGDVYERDRPRVKEGQSMKVILTSDPEHPRDCKVEWISPVIDVSTRSIKIRGRLDNHDGRLLAQMYATVVVTVSSGKDSLIVPAAAVVRKGPDAYVFVESGSSKGGLTFRRARVKVESIDAGPGLEATPPAESNRLADGAPGALAPVQMLRVTGGLSSGQQVVKSGSLGLFDEMESREHNQQQQLQSQPTAG
ncbi:MAG TPA: efflux RND transporter periplasmic adaptor subunit [Tepidisphaeraceae bacterium]|nr:efflux RND transporter periplasmic adaptor subunit [Tepidisphaeraceae bacterium]